MGKNKRPKNYYIQLAKRQKNHHNVLSPGLTGFLCTCNDRERECVVEAYNILNEYADQMYGKEKIPDEKGCSSQEEMKSVETKDETGTKISSEEKGQLNGSQQETEKDKTKTSPSQQKQEKVDASSDSDEELSLDAALKADVAELKKESEKKHRHLRRFGQVATGARNYVFIRSTLEDPLPLSRAIMDDILKQQQQKTKRLIRMIPVQATCRAFQEDIVKAVKSLCESYFREKGESFYIATKIRNTNAVERESLKMSLITVVSEAHSANTPELRDPEVVVNIDVIKNVCCISFLPGYFTKYCKYNLLSLGNKKENAKNITKTEDSKDKVPEKEGGDKVPEKEGEDKVPEKEGEDKVPEKEGEDKVPEKEGEDKIPEKEGKDKVPEKEGEVK